MCFIDEMSAFIVGQASQISDVVVKWRNLDLVKHLFGDFIELHLVIVTV